MGSDYEEEILKDVREQICPLLEERGVCDALKTILCSPKVAKTLDIITKNDYMFMMLFERIKTKKERTFLHTISYLFQVETVGNLICDILIILLSAKGSFFHIEPDNEIFFIRHAVSIEDLETPSVTLGKKLNFLKRNKLDCVGKNVKHRLRDKIAHIDYEIDDNGDFFKGTKTGKKLVDIRTEWFRILYFTTFVIKHIDQAVEEQLNTS